MSPVDKRDPTEFPTSRSSRHPALEDMELTVRALLESVPAAVIIVDARGPVVLANQVAAELFGYGSTELIGQPIELLVPEHLRAQEEVLHRAYEAEPGRRQTGAGPDLVARRKDGSTFAAEISFSPLENGRQRFIVSAIRDTTERRRSEDDYRFLAEASRALADSLDYQATLATIGRLAIDYIADICAIDVLEENGSLRRVAVSQGDPSREAIVRQLSERYSPQPTQTHPDWQVIRTGRPLLIPDITDNFLTDNTQDEDHFRLVKQLGLRSAMVVPLRAHNRTQGVMLYLTAESGRRYGPEDLALAEELAGRAAIAVDNARLHQAVQQAESRFQGIFEGTTDGILIVDPDGRYLDANPAMTELTGYTWRELRDMRLGDLSVNGEERARSIRSLLVQEAPWRHELELVRKDGSRVPVEARGTPVTLAPGKVFLISIRDISQRRAVEQLHQEFLAMVTHELRNPLAGLLGWAHMLQRRPESGAHAARVIMRQARQLDRLINDLLDAARLDTDHLELERSSFDLVELAQEIVEEDRASSEGRLVLDVADRGLVGDWDRGRVGQILRNLVSNALKYSPDGGEVRIRLESLDESVRVSVRDQGVGIAPEDQAALFERFHRAETARDKHLTGLGLGLSITKSLVEAHGGRIWVASEGEGTGATFVFTLPYEAHHTFT